MFVEILLILIGFLLLIKGADLLVMGATSIAKKFGVSELLIGLTIVALGTSLPEVFVTISASLGNHSELVIGNAIGSCICNLLLVIGITSLVHPIKLEKRIIHRHLPIEIIIALLLLLIGNNDRLENIQTITRGQGILLVLCAILYIIYTIYEEKEIKNKKMEGELIKEVESKEQTSGIKIALSMVLGIIGLKFGADFIVDNAIQIAERIKISEKVIGMTILAIGTALPEIITGVIAAKRKETALLLGNVSGSNILNLCLLIGLGAVIEPLTITDSFTHSLWMLIVLTLIIQGIAISGKKKKIDYKQGIFLIFLYGVYLCWMI